MESFSEVASTGTNSVKIQDNEILSPFVEPSTQDTFFNTGFTRLYSRDAISNSTGSYLFEYERELLPKVHDLSSLICEVYTSIVKVENGVELPITKEDNVSVTNNFVDSLWSRIRMSINNADAYSSPPNRYHYVQLSRLLCLDEPIDGKGFNYLSLSSKDDNPDSLEADLNPGFFDRQARFRASVDDVNAKYQKDPDEERLAARDSGTSPATLTEEEAFLQSSDGNAKAVLGKQQKSAEEEVMDDISRRTSRVNRRVYGLGTLTYGFMTCKQFLPFNSSLQIQLDRESDEYLLHAISNSSSEAKKYKIKIHNVGLYLKYYLLKDDIYKHLKSKYESGLRTKMFFFKPYTHATLMEVGTRHFSKDIGFRGRQLCKLFVVFMKPQRYNGNREYCSGIYKQPPKLQTASLRQGDRDPLQLAPNMLRTPATSLLEKLYFDFLVNLQVLGAETERNTISFEKFKSTAFVMSMNCVASGTLQSDKLPLLREGPIHLDILLEEPLSKPMYVFYLGYTVSTLSVAPGQPCLISDELSYERN